MTRMTKIITTVTTAFFSLGFFSCSNFQDSGAIAMPFVTPASDANVAYLTLSLDDATVSKTLLPDVQSAVFSSLVLKGTKQGEYQKTLGSWTSVAAMQSSSVPLEVGSWTFDLNATSGGSSFSGTLQKEIVSGQNALLFNLALDDIGSGPGSFSLALSFDGAANAQNVSRVVASLENMDKTIVSGYEPKNLAISNNAVTFSGSQITAGTYRAKIKFYASVNGGDTEIASWSELVQIASGFDSSANRTIESFDELYTITYELNGGSFTAGTVAPETFTRRSNVTLPSLENVLRYDSAYGGPYKALGWYTDKNCTEGNEITSVENITQNITVYANWPLLYKITYNLNGGFFGSGYAPREKFIQSDVVELPDAEKVLRDYYLFRGWYTDENCTEENKMTMIENKSSNVTVYAKWSPVVYKITSWLGVYSSETTYTIEDDVTLDVPQDEGVSFIGWYEDESYTGNSVTGWNAGERHDDITLYADYTMSANMNVDENSIIRIIGMMKTSGTITATGVFSSELIGNLSSILSKVRKSNSNIRVKLDLSAATGAGNIEENAFYGCSSLSSVSLPAGINSIDACAFLECPSLSSVSLPASVNRIEARAFERCESLSSISISDGLTYIGKFAFSGCKSLQKISIPDSVKIIDQSAFLNCYALKTVNLPSGLAIVNQTVFCNCRQLENITLPASLKSICTAAFSGCTGLKSITMPSGMEEIGVDAFEGCYFLEKVTFADTTKPWYYRYRNVSYANNHVGGAISSLSNPYANADMLKETYVNCYWLTTDRPMVY